MCCDPITVFDTIRTRWDTRVCNWRFHWWRSYRQFGWFRNQPIFGFWGMDKLLCNHLQLCWYVFQLAVKFSNQYVALMVNHFIDVLHFCVNILPLVNL